MICLPNEIPAEYVSENLGRYARGYVQQRISGAFEFDYVPIALFDLLLQGSYGVDVDLATHTNIHVASVLRNESEQPLTSISTLDLDFLALRVYSCGDLEVTSRGRRRRW